MLTEWSLRDYCPKEFDEYRVLPHTSDNTDSEDDDNSFLYERNRLNRIRDDRSGVTLSSSRSIFDSAIEACSLDWDDTFLQSIITRDSISSLNSVHECNQNIDCNISIWRG